LVELACDDAVLRVRTGRANRGPLPAIGRPPPARQFR